MGRLEEWQKYSQEDVDAAMAEAQARGCTERQIDEVLMRLWRAKDRAIEYSQRGREEMNGMALRAAYHSFKALIPGKKSHETVLEAKARLGI